MGRSGHTSPWSQIKSGIEAGDFLLVQFGHNDETHDCPRYVSTADYEIDLGIMADTEIDGAQRACSRGARQAVRHQRRTGRLARYKSAMSDSMRGPLFCPWCGEPADIHIDEGAGSHQEYVEDCAVCCHPCVITVEPADDEDDPPVVGIERE